METVKTPAHSGLTPEQYRAIDANVEDARFEYDGTRAYMLAGASVEHNQVASNIHTALATDHQQCRVFQSDMRVRAGEHYTYPDVVMLCTEPEVTDEDPPSLLNPELLVEVLSASTADRDQT